jgi:predicted alpha/beta-hydrolase family hydrolase
VSPESTLWRIDVGQGSNQAVFEPANPPSDTLLVLGHGAGGSMSTARLVEISRDFRDAGIGVIRFNFLYREASKNIPDKMPRLVECFEAVVAKARSEVKPKRLLIGGHSMGGRVASMMAAEQFDCDGLVLLSYPLHPPGKLDKLRDAHLSAITRPVICFNGTNDEFCTPELMVHAVKALTHFNMNWIEGADHSLHVPKSSGTTDVAIRKLIATKVADWSMGLPASA